MNILNTLTQLQNDELVHPDKDESSDYIFKHALTHETAYHSLLKTQRRDLHRATAQAIEQTFPNRKGQLSAVLAYHWEQAEVPDRARRYLYRAAQDAMRRYANQEALAFFARALAQRNGAKPDELLALYESRARIFEFLSQYAQAIDDYQAALPLAREAHREIDECRILSQIAWMYSLSGRGEEAVQTAIEVETRARALQDHTAMLRAYLVQGLVAQAKGHLADAYPRLRAALIASRASDEPVMEGESWFYLGIENNFMGRFGRAAACAQKAHTLKKGLSDRVGEIVTLYLLARAEGGRGNYDAALDALEHGRAIANEIRNPFGLAQYPNTRAWLAAELGDWQTAYELDRAGLDIARHAPIRPPEISTLINLVLDCVALGKLDEAETYVLDAQQWMGKPEFGFHAWRWETRLTDARARLLIAHQLYDDAAPLVIELLDWAERTQSTKYRARGLVLRAHIHLATNDLARAENDLQIARHLGDVMNYIPLQIQARRLLAGVCAGNAAQQYRVEATRIVDDLGKRLEQSALQKSFECGIGTVKNVA
jgi:tetratricopeptide (TPR) repeat protein